MSITNNVLIPAKIAEAGDTLQYTAPTGSGVAVVIDKFTATNYDTVARTISVNLVTAAGSAGNANLIVKTKSLQPGVTYMFPEIVGQTLGHGDMIYTNASNATGVNIRASGRIYG